VKEALLEFSSLVVFVVAVHVRLCEGVGIIILNKEMKTHKKDGYQTYIKIENMGTKHRIKIVKRWVQIIERNGYKT